jgi:hypothetical protein
MLPVMLQRRSWHCPSDMKDVKITNYGNVYYDNVQGFGRRVAQATCHMILSKTAASDAVHADGTCHITSLCIPPRRAYAAQYFYPSDETLKIFRGF